MRIEKYSLSFHETGQSLTKCISCPNNGSVRSRWLDAPLHLINTLRPRQNGRHFTDDIFKCIFLNENISFPIKVSLKFVPKGPINNIPSLVQKMDWRRSGDKPLSEPMMVYRRIYASIGLKELTGSGRCNGRRRLVIFKLGLLTDYWGIFCEIALRWLSLDLIDDLCVNIDSAKGLVPPSSKPLPEAILTQSYAAIRRH